MGGGNSHEHYTFIRLLRTRRILLIGAPGDFLVPASKKFLGVGLFGLDYFRPTLTRWPGKSGPRLPQSGISGRSKF